MHKEPEEKNITVLEVENVKRHYTQKGKYVTLDGKVLKNANICAVDGVSFTLKKGETLGIIGESGCGKSTLARLLVGLEHPTSGNITIAGESTREIIKRDRLNFHRTTQMIFQNPFDVFDPRFSIGKALNDTLKLHKIGKGDIERREVIIEKLENTGFIPAVKFLNRFPHELSGGQLQRIAILRSMMLEPLVIVADEPVSMLDVSIRADVINMLYSMVKDQLTSLIFISHDICTTRYISDKILVMYLGRIVEVGSADDIATNPKHPYTKALISNCANIDPRKEYNPIRLEGEPATPINLPAGCSFEPRCPVCTPECKVNAPELQLLENGRYVSCRKT